MTKPERRVRLDVATDPFADGPNGKPNFASRKARRQARKEAHLAEREHDAALITGRIKSGFGMVGAHRKAKVEREEVPFSPAGHKPRGISVRMRDRERVTIKIAGKTITRIYVQDTPRFISHDRRATRFVLTGDRLGPRDEPDKL